MGQSHSSAALTTLWPTVESLLNRLMVAAANDQLLQLTTTMEQIKQFNHNYPDQPVLTVNSRDCSGDFALSIATIHSSFEMIQYLIEKQRADVNQQDAAGYSPLICAILAERVEVAEYLIQEAKANVNLVSKEGESALILAIKQNLLPIVRLILQQPGVNINTLDKKGNSALLYAGKQYSPHLHVKHAEIMIALLIQEGADTAHRNQENQCIYDYIKEGSLQDLIEQHTVKPKYESEFKQLSAYIYDYFYEDAQIAKCVLQYLIYNSEEDEDESDYSESETEGEGYDLHYSQKPTVVIEEFSHINFHPPSSLTNRRPSIHNRYAHLHEQSANND
jgi:ankyrin repeat protein